MPLPRLADQVRHIALHDICRQLGLEPQAEGHHNFRVKNEVYNLCFRGQKFIDHRSATAGGGAIDLTMFLRGCSCKEACLWLHEVFLGRSPHPPTPARTFAFSSSALSETKPHQEPRCGALWGQGRAYLHEVRKIPLRLLEEAWTARLLYTNPRGNLVFAHVNVDGVMTGCSLRPSIHRSGFRRCLGRKTDAWFSTGDRAAAHHCVICESAIDALSFSALHGGDKVVVFSAAGNFVPRALLELAFARQWSVTIALDNDAAGRHGYRHALKRWEELFPGTPAPVERVPWNKDWNEDLQHHA